MRRTSLSLRAGVAAALFIATIAVAHAVARDTSATSQANLAVVPMTLAPWVGAPGPGLTEDVVDVVAADQYVHRFYTSAAGTIEMDIAYYARPRIGANMHSPLNCLPGNGWQVTESHATEVGADGRMWPVRELLVERGRDRYAMTYWFQSQDRIVASELQSRFYVFADALRRQPTDATLVRLMVPLSQGTPHQNQSQVGAMLTAFASRLIPEIGRALISH